jgi:hypothetical protein
MPHEQLSAAERRRRGRKKGRKEEKGERKEREREIEREREREGKKEEGEIRRLFDFFFFFFFFFTSPRFSTLFENWFFELYARHRDRQLSTTLSRVWNSAGKTTLRRPVGRLTCGAVGGRFGDECAK